MAAVCANAVYVQEAVSDIENHAMTEPLIAELETSLRERLALSEHPARIAGRDRKISALRALKDGKDDA